METINAIHSRKSIRKYQDKEISKDIIHEILRAGMAGPSAVNARPWEFIVVDDRETLDKMSEANGKAATLLKGAPLAIMVCGNLDKAYHRCPEFWAVDATIACQNMILAAHDMGIGSCWLGTYPFMPKSDAQKALFNLPENIVPHSIIAFGYPAEDPDKSAKPVFEDQKVHYNKF